MGKGPNGRPMARPQGKSGGLGPEGPPKAGAGKVGKLNPLFGSASKDSGDPPVEANPDDSEYKMKKLLDRTFKSFYNASYNLQKVDDY